VGCPKGYREWSMDEKFDCNDHNILIHPGAKEIFNGMDDDCDKQIDEGFVEPHLTLDPQSPSDMIVIGNNTELLRFAISAQNIALKLHRLEITINSTAPNTLGILGFYMGSQLITDTKPPLGGWKNGGKAVFLFNFVEPTITSKKMIFSVRTHKAGFSHGDTLTLSIVSGYNTIKTSFPYQGQRAYVFKATGIPVQGGTLTF